MGEEGFPLVQGVITMAIYKLYMHYALPREEKVAKINARDLDELRRIAIKDYGNDLKDKYFGNFVVGPGSDTHIGDFTFIHGAWMWNVTKIDGFEIDPATGGKMKRYEKGYDVKGTTASGRKMDHHFPWDGIDYLRSILMNQSNYGDRRAGTFTIYRDGKKLGKLQMGSNGRWIWESVSGARYYPDIQGKLNSQIRRS